MKYKFLFLLAPLLIFPFETGRTEIRSKIMPPQEIQLRPTVKKHVAAQNKPARNRSGQSKSPDADIRAVLDAQVAAWNEGKLEDFMEGYWRSPNLTFFSGGRKLSGWDATIERYRKTYQAEGREMGKLAFSDLDIQRLGESAAVVRGRFELTMSDGKKLSGIYTLIFRRFKHGWKIVHDHTSSDQ